MKVEYVNPFVETSFQVLKEVLGGTSVTRGDLYLKSTAMPVMGVAVVVGFAGEIEGRVLFDMTLETALNFASQMNGEILRKFDDLAKNTICELANIITSQSVTKFHEPGLKFDLTPPVLFVGENMEIAAFSGLSENVEALIVPMITEFGKVEVNVSLRENFSQKSCSPKDIVKTKIQTPNLFSFATSELSQDAFFAWFFSWAESKYKNVDKDLHECAKTSLARFYGSGLPNEIYSIEIQKQYNNIDLWLKINDEYDLIIEDKTNTTMHDNQLARYKSYFVDNKKSRFVYLKTGDFKSGEENFARINGYRIIDTFILDDLFKNCLTANEIFKDYSNMIRTRKIIKQLVQKFNELNLYSRCDMYKNTCLYFWFNFNKQNQSFLALDIVFSLQCQKLELIFHGKKDGKGSWIDSGDELDLLIKHISPKVRKILNNYDFEPKYNYYTSSIEYEDSLDVFNLLKNLINELEKVINYSLIN